MSEAHELASAWRASGKSQAAWCRSQGIAKWTLKSCLAWVNRPELTLRRPRSVGAVSGFIAVHPPAVVAVMLGLREGSR